MSRVLLILPTATYRAPDFLAAAASVGADVVVGCEEPQTLAPLMGERALLVELARPDEALDAIVDLHRRSPLDAVVAVDDQGVLVAASAGERLGLRHNPPTAVRATRDKAALRAALAVAPEVLQPAWRVARPDDDVARLASAVGLPCVVKPVSLSGSRGVIRADDSGAALAAAERVRAILASAGEDPGMPLLVERFVPGREVAVEALLDAGALEVLAVFDKPDPLEGPYFEETLYVTPSRLPAPDLFEVQAVTGRACAALGLVEGPIHAELRITDAGPSGPERRSGPVLLEVAGRSIGGLCSRALRFGAGISLEEVVLRHALGLPQKDLGREHAASGVMMLPIPRAGTLRNVDGQEDARAVPGIVGLEITIRPGRPVTPLPEGDRYLGFLFARADTPANVELALRTAHARLQVDVA